MRKQGLSITLSVLILLAMTACGNSEKPAEETLLPVQSNVEEAAQTPEQTPEEPVTAEALPEESAAQPTEEPTVEQPEQPPETDQEPEPEAELTRAEKLLLDAESGNGRAYTDLGKMYESGNGVEQDYEKALEYYLLSAEAENPDFKGMRMAGLMYMNGTGVEQDYEKAAECFQKAADSGDVSGAWFLGQLYEQGNGVEQNMEQARACYETAIAQLDRFTGGNNKGPDELKQALCRLAEMALEDGDTEAAISYYQTAYDLGWEAAGQALTELGVEPEAG